MLPDGAHLATKARHNRQQASLYELQQEIVRQAKKTGTRVVFVEGPYTPICATCGQMMAVEADLMVSCPKGHVWDQDEVAARNIYRARVAEAEPAPAKAPPMSRGERIRVARRRRQAQRRPSEWAVRAWTPSCVGGKRTLEAARRTACALVSGKVSYCQHPQAISLQCAPKGRATGAELSTRWNREPNALGPMATRIF